MLQCPDGETRTRTGDTTIFSRVLYQLSYLAAEQIFDRQTILAAPPCSPSAQGTVSRARRGCQLAT
jgi:hypothetical protein